MNGKKRALWCAVPGAAELALYLLPLFSHGGSYSTCNEETGESGMEVVRWHASIVTDLMDSPFAALVAGGLLLAALALALGILRAKKPESRRLKTAWALLTALSAVVFLAALALELMSGRSA